MTNGKFCGIVTTVREKWAYKMSGKEMTMNTVMNFSYPLIERYQALSKDQGLLLLCSNKIMRKSNCRKSEDRC